MVEEKLVHALMNKKNTISFGESITGGMLASTIINVGGSSNVIKESYVTYSNESKTKILGVSPATIDQYSVVSKEVVTEMAQGLYKVSGANVCACVSGYAETVIPNQGYAWYAILINNEKYNNYLITKEIEVNGSRNEVRKTITEDILNDILELIEG